MNNFYGGERGFSFILKPNPSSLSNGYWKSLNEIIIAARDGKIQYGDYVIITNDLGQYTNQHGCIYRIDRDKNPILIGKIGNPAPLFDIAIVENLENANEVTFTFMDDEESVIADSVKVYWKIIDYTYQDSNNESHTEQRIGISFAFPKPIITFNNFHTTNFKTQINNSDIKSGSGIFKVEQQNRPMDYKYNVFMPPNIAVGKSKDLLDNLRYFEDGDLFFQTFDKEDDSLDIYSQFTIDMREMVMHLEDSNITNEDSETNFYFVADVIDNDNSYEIIYYNNIEENEYYNPNYTQDHFAVLDNKIDYLSTNLQLDFSSFIDKRVTQVFPPKESNINGNNFYFSMNWTFNTAKNKTFTKIADNFCNWIAYFKIYDYQLEELNGGSSEEIENPNLVLVLKGDNSLNNPIQILSKNANNLFNLSNNFLVYREENGVFTQIDDISDFTFDISRNNDNDYRIIYLDKIFIYGSAEEDKQTYVENEELKESGFQSIWENNPRVIGAAYNLFKNLTFTVYK